MALTTKSASGWVATRTAPSGPDTTSVLVEFSLDSRIAASDSVATEIIWGRQRWGWSKARARLRPAARVVTWKRSGKDSTTLRVLRPMLPVEPRMARRFMDRDMVLERRLWAVAQRPLVRVRAGEG